MRYYINNNEYLREKIVMTGRERFLTALNNQKPDRLPVQVHSWMQYYLNKKLNGADQFEAYNYFGMDPVIYMDPTMIFDNKDFENWQVVDRDLGVLHDGYHHYEQDIITPAGKLSRKWASNEFTWWLTEHIIKSEDDFEIWQKYNPRPVAVDWSNVIEAKKRIGDTGIVRGTFYDFGQCSPWQSFASGLFGTEDAIMACFDKPEWVHYVLNCLLERKIQAIEVGGKQELDLVECGGGGGSSTVISPSLHKEFCLPYDKKQIDAFQNQGAKVVYHLCGGIMPLLEIVAENGTDVLETMTPPEMGGDCDFSEATSRIGDKLAFIGGFDQNKGFEKGNPKEIKEMVHKLFEQKPNGGYICSPSDHFFFGETENIKAFVQAAKECKY